MNVPSQKPVPQIDRLCFCSARPGDNVSGARWTVMGAVLIIAWGFMLGPLACAESGDPVPSTSASAWAPTLSTLERGMSYYDVVRLLGAPLDKKELESRRGDIWKYPNQKIIFQGGKVVAWMREDEAGIAGSESSAASGEDGSLMVTQEKDLDKRDLENLLGEIVSDLDQKQLN